MINVYIYSHKTKSIKVNHLFEHAVLKGLSSQNLESNFIIFYEEFEGTDHESATYF